MQQSDNSERREVYYRGMVQGVGFRYTVRSFATQFAVSGYVRNLSDGRVFLVAEGLPEELDRFLDAVGTHLDCYIRQQEVTVLAATGEFGQFDIRY